ncbi:hypothetical protein [Actinomadura verrucosospora]|uniref:hypothetical protein n=1 Tax=Actinomadura verrucosospora TaxID=46165 RepID=UPI001565BC42|nr:hypothetical protein [Actinomadura verrucosospora]
MRMDDGDREPVFRRRSAGRYEYNPRNPVGAALIVVTVIAVIVGLLMMAGHTGPFAPAQPSTPVPTTSSGATQR